MKIIQWSKLGLGVVAFGSSLLVATSAPASAAQHQVDQVAAAKGSNPNAPICKFGKEVQKVAEKDGSAEGADIQSGNIAGLKKILIADINAEAKLLKSNPSAVSSLPGNVKAAYAAEIKQLPQFAKAVEGLTSISQFSKLSVQFGQTKQSIAAEKVLDKYTTALCGSAL